MRVILICVVSLNCILVVIVAIVVIVVVVARVVYLLPWRNYTHADTLI